MSWILWCDRARLWLKARAGLRVHSGWARPPGLPRLQPSRELSGGVSGWGCVVLRHNLANSERRPAAGAPVCVGSRSSPSLLSIGPWRGAHRHGMRRHGLACGRRLHSPAFARLLLAMLYDDFGDLRPSPLSRAASSMFSSHSEEKKPDADDSPGAFG